MPTHDSSLQRHARNAASVLLLITAVGASSPLTPTATAATTTPSGTVELSPSPPNVTQGVPPNVAITFDDSGSMQWDFLSDNPPWLTFNSSGYNQPVNVTWNGTNADTGRSGSGGPWYCAGVINPTATSGLNTHVMNGVYYNPKVTYTPPIYADGTSFPNADATLKSVWNDGITWNRPLNPSTSGGTTNFNNSTSFGQTGYWNCPYDNGQGYYLGMRASTSANNNNSSPVSSGGPYYYQYVGPALATNQYGNPTNAALSNLYNSNNWQAVAVPKAQYQNWANWWAYYRTHNQAARSALSRVFASSSLAGTTSTGGYGGTIRVAWQNLYNGLYGINDQFVLQQKTIITSLIDANPTTCKSNEPSLGSQSLLNGTVTAPPSCYRSDFYNWIFQVPAQSGTPTRSSLIRAGQFFQRGSGNTGSSGDLHDPYWQPPASGTGTAGNELSCRQNFHLLLTDGLWNADTTLPAVSTLQSPAGSLTLPDGTPFPDPSNAVTAIYAPQDDSTGDPSLSDLAFNYWATNLRPDLYDPTNSKFVPPYLPDTTLGVTPTTVMSANGLNNAHVNNEIYFNPANDPANWPHMSEYLVGMGVSGQLNFSTNTDCTDTTTPSSSDACNLRQGTANSSGAVGWPQPSSTAGGGNGLPANIDDTWHAALAGRGQFFSAGNPQQLVDQLSSVLTSITARAAQPSVSAVNASVLTLGALSFNTGYSTVDWSGVLQAVSLNADGTIGSLLWDAGTTLSNATVTVPGARQIVSSSLSSTGATVATGISFEAGSAFDASESSTSVGGLMYPSANGTSDTLAARVNYLRGVRTLEASSVMRKRNTLLGAIINSQATYVSYPSSGYTDSWPAGSPEAIAAAASNGTDDKSYSSFVSDHASRNPILYMGANDGLLHAFYAPVPTCTATDTNGNCTSYTSPTSGSYQAGQETLAYVPRGVYGNLGNLTSANNFNFAPTVDATPVVRDAFLGSDSKWHSLLVGGLRLGGRGVYVLDITNPWMPGTPTSPPSTTTETQAAGTVVKWEFDADMTASSSCVAVMGSSVDSTGCRSSDLGYTYGQPNIGRLANGKWVVIVPSGYFPDCTTSDRPTNCSAVSAQAPKDSSGNPYSALFIFDADTGAMIAELKTPTSISGVSSYGLTSPVLGDYNGDQVDDVAFAGDLAGNLWRFDLSDSSPANWKVTLSYQPSTQGAQPITVMPRLFPDPTTNRFMVVFGTGKYLGANDNSSTTLQSVYGIRDLAATSSPVTRSTLQSQTLAEMAVNTGPNTGAIVRTLTSNTVSATQNGWYFDLNLSNAAGERVVVTPAAIFNSNTLVLTTLIPGSIDPCNPSVLGAAMFIDGLSGGAGNGVSSLGGGSIVGARVNNVRTSGSIPVTTVIGGGQTLLPGLTLTGKQNNTSQPIAGNSPIWRRRSWSELNNAQ